MKKTKAAADQPIGIVIAAGRIAASNPRVKAYFWCDVDTASVSQPDDETQFAK